MRPVQHIIIVVDREGRWRPTGGGGVAHRAICRQVQRHVVGIRGLIEIRRMARRALRRRTHIAPCVAIHTIGRQVRTC